jgi:hypothetical protein
LHSLSAKAEQFFQEPTIPPKERSKGIIGGQSDMQVRNFEHVFGDIGYLSSINTSWKK